MSQEKAQKDKIMDAKELKRALNQADTTILDFFSTPPQCGARISEKDRQHALGLVLKKDKSCDEDKLNDK